MAFLHKENIFQKNEIMMSILRLFPVLCKQEVVKFQPFCYGCSTILQNRFGSSKAVKKLPPSRNKKSTSKAAKNATAGGGDRLRIAYHNDHVTQQAVKRDEFVHDLKFETPPLLFIKEGYANNAKFNTTKMAQFQDFSKGGGQELDRLHLLPSIRTQYNYISTYNRTNY